MIEKVKILAVCVSPKSGGHTERLLDKFVVSARKFGAQVKQIELYRARTRLMSVSGKLGSKLRKVNSLQKAILKADGFVIATPTYWFNMPGVLKNFVDQLTILEENGFLLEGKVAGFIVYAPQGGDVNVLQNLTIIFNHMGALLPPYGLIFYRGPQDSWVKDDLKRLAYNIIQQVKAGKQLKLKWDHLDKRYKVSPIELLPKKLTK